MSVKFKWDSKNAFPVSDVETRFPSWQRGSSFTSQSSPQFILQSLLSCYQPRLTLVRDSCHSFPSSEAKGHLTDPTLTVFHLTIIRFQDPDSVDDELFLTSCRFLICRPELKLKRPLTPLSGAHNDPVPSFSSQKTIHFPSWRLFTHPHDILTVSGRPWRGLSLCLPLVHTALPPHNEKKEKRNSVCFLLSVQTAATSPQCGNRARQPSTIYWTLIMVFTQKCQFECENLTESVCCL